jgi:hypothetical protein
MESQALKAMALGGLDTGIMRAYEQQIVTGNIRNIGFIPIPRACKHGFYWHFLRDSSS